MFLDISSDLHAEGEVLSHRTVNDRVKGLDVHRYSYREEKHTRTKTQEINNLVIGK